MHARFVPGPADRRDPRLDALLRRLDAEGHPGLSERKRLDLLDAAPGSFGIEYDDEDGHLVGYLRCVAGGARVGDGAPRRTIELVTHPHWRGRVEAEMLAVLYVGVLGQGGGSLTWWITEPTQERLAQGWGWTLERRLERLERPLAGIHPTPAQPGVSLRPLEDGPAERAALLAVNNAAFAGHPEQGAWSGEDLERRFATEWFDPSLVLVAQRAGRTIGFCWLKRHAGGRELEVYAIATQVEEAPAGTGRALLTTALHDAARRHPEATASLYVDAANARACALYRRLGFTFAAHQHAYRVVVPDGRPDPHRRARPPAAGRHRLGVRSEETTR